MKTYKDYLIDFDKLKVGDKLWSTNLGEVIITHLDLNNEMPIDVKNIYNGRFDSYTKEGTLYVDDKIPTLFKEKPDFFKERKEVKRWKWYYQISNDLDGGVTGNKYTEEEFENISHNYCLYEKIDCTETTEVVYE